MGPISMAGERLINRAEKIIMDLPEGWKAIVSVREKTFFLKRGIFEVHPWGSKFGATLASELPKPSMKTTPQAAINSHVKVIKNYIAELQKSIEGLED